MRRPAKKANSRESFAAVFEQQTRRFSAFELLGLSTESSSKPQQNSNETESVEKFATLPTAASSGDEIESLRSDPQGEALLPNPQVEDHRPDSQVQDKSDEIESLRSDPQGEALLPNPQVEDHVQYSLTHVLTVDPQHLYQTVRLDMGQTPSYHGPDHQTQVNINSNVPKLLAPLQWAVWCCLKKAETSNRVTSYRQIAKEAKATADGVKKAVNVIQKEGGILKKEIVRSVVEQGFRVKLNPEVMFRAATLNEAKGVLKRGIYLGLTGGSKVQDLRPDGQSMYVCKNLNIKQTDVAALLRVPPVEWKIREQTLIQIADTLPDMTAIEFRLSLNYLVDQGKTAREPIRNHNAWVKAAFEKNKGPLVTEREIEVRFEQSVLKRDVLRPINSMEKHNDDSELLRLYLACSPDERAQIDLLTEVKAAPLLKIVSEDKKAGVLEEARREAALTFLSKK